MELKRMKGKDERREKKGVHGLYLEKGNRWFNPTHLPRNPEVQETGSQRKTEPDRKWEAEEKVYAGRERSQQRGGGPVFAGMTRSLQDSSADYQVWGGLHYMQ